MTQPPPSSQCIDGGLSAVGLTIGSRYWSVKRTYLCEEAILTALRRTEKRRIQEKKETSENNEVSRWLLMNRTVLSRGDPLISAEHADK